MKNKSDATKMAFAFGSGLILFAILTETGILDEMKTMLKEESKKKCYFEKPICLKERRRNDRDATK